MADPYLEQKYARIRTLVAAADRTNLMTAWERNFIREMKAAMEGLEDYYFLIRVDWRPTVKQWNTITALEQKLKV